MFTFSDEATLYLHGLINKCSCKTNPCVTIESVMTPPKLNVWCAMIKNQLIGSFFFDDTVNRENYLSMLQQLFIPEIRK